MASQVMRCALIFLVEDEPPSIFDISAMPGQRDGIDREVARQIYDHIYRRVLPVFAPCKAVAIAVLHFLLGWVLAADLAS